MDVFYTAESLQKKLESLKLSGDRIGFVPTMGALHEGHLKLVEKAAAENDHVVVSIFVNPTQFNNAEDLKKYPRTLEADITLLSEVDNVLVFAPDKNEIYPENDHFDHFDFRGKDKIMEGEFRPGHFQGVVHVVYNLFSIVKPDKAYFGLKDFQQVALIRMMLSFFNLSVDMVVCETVRTENGLALSSRNMRLSEKEKEDALIIYNTLLFMRSLDRTLTPVQVKKMAENYFSQGNLKLEYLEIVDDHTLEPLRESWTSNVTCCIAAFCGDVRLIDNMQIRP